MIRTKPWRHQREAADFALARRGRAMLCVPMGGGKSLSALIVADESKARTVVILCPVSVIGVWRREFARHAPGMFTVICPDGSVSDKAGQARQSIDLAEARGERVALVLNYEAAWRSPLATMLTGRTWDLLILEECLPAGTTIDTPKGNVPIEELGVGDAVYGLDHDSGQTVETTVRHCFVNDTVQPLTKVAGVPMTWNHPVWTSEHGYAIGASVSDFDTVCVNVSNHQMVRRLREALPSLGQAGHLLESLRLSMAQDRGPLLIPAGLLQGVREGFQASPNEHDVLFQELQEQGYVQAAGAEGQVAGGHAGGHFQAGSPGEASGALVRGIEPAEGPAGAGQSQSDKRIQRIRGLEFAQGGQRTRPDDGPGDPRRFARLADGDRDSNRFPAEGRRPDQLQIGHREHGVDDRGGSRRPRPQDGTLERSRPEEGSFPFGLGLEGNPIYEQGSLGRSGGLRPQGIRVHNIETGTGNYFADGLLVHNCHRIKSPFGKASKFATDLARCCRQRLALTGTPAPHSPLDLFAQARAVDPSVFGWSFVSFRNRYAVTHPEFKNKVTRWINQGELQAKFRGLAYECDLAGVLDVPEATDQIVTVRLGTKARKLYGQLEAEMWAQLDKGEISVGNALTRLLRLQQITSGWLPADDGPVNEIDDAKRKALADLIEDVPADVPIVAFARFVRDLDAIAEVATAAGRAYGEISGRRKDLTPQAEMPAGIGLMGVQIQAGGVGIDLTAAGVAIYYSVGTSLGDYLQSRARLHRPGQKRHVAFLHLIAEETVDETVMAALERKQEVIDVVLRGRAPRVASTPEAA